jgi:hypothetical protein
MNMKDHILLALKEQFNRWEELLATKSEEQITTPQLSSSWSIKDVIAHVGAWQQRAVARFEAATLNREPEFPSWSAILDSDAEDATDQANASIYDAYREQPWSTIHPNWREGFLRVLELAEAISEKDLLDAGRYPWLKGYSLAFMLLASYDHHQAHLDELLALHQSRNTRSAG